MKAAIPKEFINANRCATVDDDVSLYEMLLNTNFKTSSSSKKDLKDLDNKDIYNIFIASKNIKIESKTYWKSKFDDFSLRFDFWFKCNFTSKIMPRKCIDFNWKLFHGRLSTEMQLKRMKFSDGMCILCKQNEENLDHLLIGCESIGSIWKYIEGIIGNFLKKEYSVCDKVIICGTMSPEMFETNVII